MRYLIASILLFAIPGFASAQQAGDATLTDTPVQIEQSVTTDDVTLTPVTAGVDADTERATEAADAPVENAAVQDPGSRHWWYIVGAVVVGALIVAALL